MKKTYSLVKACMKSNMSLFKIKTKKNGKSATIIPIIIAIYLMFMIGTSTNSLFEKLAPMNLAYILLSQFVFGISLMTFMEGIYKSGPLIFNCKDDQLLLSLPIKKTTVLFIRIFKFYIFELLFNSLLLFPVMISYIRWDNNISWTYFLTCFIMLLMLPIIPIVLSCIIGVITSNISSRFRYKNAAQIIISMIFLVGIMYLSFNMDKIFEYIIKHASSMNDLITKIYYPAGIYAKLVIDFNIKDLLIFILINLGILIITLFILSKFYFKINSRMKKVTINSNTSRINILKFKRNTPINSLIKKELNTFFKTPVFIINAGFALILFLILTVAVTKKFDSFIPLLTNKENGLGLSLNIIKKNMSILIFMLVSLTSFMTSITNSVISLEGKNINIMKSLPIKAKTILISKVYAALVITTPVLWIGNIILFIRFKINIIEIVLLLILSILIPLVSHFIGIIINLKYPKLDWENTTEVVKQSTSSFIAVMLGMILFIISIFIIVKLIGKYNSILILSVATIFYIIIDTILYLYLINKSINDFNDLNV